MVLFVLRKNVDRQGLIHHSNIIRFYICVLTLLINLIKAVIAKKTAATTASSVVATKNVDNTKNAIESSGFETTAYDDASNNEKNNKIIAEKLDGEHDKSNHTDDDDIDYNGKKIKTILEMAKIVRFVPFLNILQ